MYVNYTLNKRNIENDFLLLLALHVTINLGSHLTENVVNDRDIDLRLKLFTTI